MSMYDNNLPYLHFSGKIFKEKPSEFFKGLLRKELVDVWLNDYVHILAVGTYLTAVNHCSTIF